MSTRSRIGMQNVDGTVRSVYCHSDGYPSYNGQLLIDHYTDPAKVNELIDLGSLSSLAENIGEKHDFDWMHQYFKEGGNYHEDPRYHMVKAYGRDRGETDVDADIDDNADAMYHRAAEGWEEYAYLFRDGQWFVTPVGGGAGPFMVTASDPEGKSPADWQLVSDVLAKEKAAA